MVCLKLNQDTKYDLLNVNPLLLKLGGATPWKTETIIPPTLAEYEIIITNFALCAMLVIYQLIFSTAS